MKHTRCDRILALFLALLLVLPLAVPAVHADDEQEQPPASEATAPAGTEPGEPQTGLPQETMDTQPAQNAEQTSEPSAEPTGSAQSSPMMDEPMAAAEGTPSVEIDGTPNSWGRYCALPGLTFSNTKTVDITVSTSSTESKSEKDVEPGNVAAKVQELLGGRLGDISLTLHGENGETATATYTYGHVLGGRSSYTVPATCSQDGYTVSYYMCPSCDQPFGESKTVIPADESKHQYVDVAIDCSGDTQKVCKLCGKNEQGVEVDTTGNGHDWVEGSSNQDCEHDEATWKYCTKCKAIQPGSYQVTKAATGHRYGFWKTTQQPDCTTPGQQEAQCMNPNCESKITQTLPVQHTYGSRTSLQGKGKDGEYDATCTTASASGYICKKCGAINPSGIRYDDATFGTKALGHDYEASHDCTQEVTCKRCGEKAEAYESHDLKWSYGSNGSTHTARCTRSGCTYTVTEEAHTPPADYDCTKPFTCAECGKYVDAQYKNHVYGANEYVDENYHVKKCTHPGCNASIEGAHSKDDGNCATEWKCTGCGQVLKPAESHQWGPYVSSGGYHYKVCQNDGCGQTTAKEVHKPDSAYGVDYDCTKGIHCRDCGAMMVPAAIGHNTYGAPILGDAEGHYQQCQTKGCTGTQRVTGANANHTGGEATCQSRAICTICHEEYGEKDSGNHTHIVVEGQKNPTNTEKGYTGDRKCADCGTIIENGTEIPTLQESCQHQFEKKYDDEACWDQCTICGYMTERVAHTLEQKSDAEHHWEQCKICKYVTTKNPHTPETDDHDCETALKCTECGYELEAAQTHQYGSQYAYGENGHWHVCTNPGCEKTDEEVAHVLPADDGDCTTEVVCQVCGYIVKQAFEHVPSSVWESDGEQHYQRCLNEGCKAHLLAEAHTPAENDYLCTTPEICAVCQRVLKAGEEDHNWGGEVFSNEAGHWHACGNPGCTATEPELPHVGGEATCTNPAACEICGTHYGEVDPEKHGAIKLVGHVNPTTEAEGYSGDQVCQDCGAVVQKGMILAKLEESPAPCTHENAHTLYEDAEKHWKVCEDCGAWFQEEPHQYDEGIVTVEPSCTSVGQRERSCTVCGRKMIEEIPKTAHTYDEDGKCTVCGTDQYAVSGGGTWDLQDSSGGMAFQISTISGNFAGYNLVLVNGVVLKDGTDYTFDRATGVLVLTEAYLNTLEPGSYELEIEYVDGTATISFQVTRGAHVRPDLPGPGQEEATTTPTAPITKPESEDSDVPKTGDETPLPILLALCVLSGGVAACLLPSAAKRRKKN